VNAEEKSHQRTLSYLRSIDSFTTKLLEREKDAVDRGDLLRAALAELIEAHDMPMPAGVMRWTWAVERAREVLRDIERKDV
jgi:hypothetical protein